MNRALVDRIVAAVLYEGYILYPYRPALKNRQRWTFGGLFPESYSLAHNGSDACSMQTECLVHGGTQTRLDIAIRFLHLMARQVGALEQPLMELPADVPAFRKVASLSVDGRLWQTWQEAVEREVKLAEAELTALLDRPCRHSFAFPSQRQLEPIRSPEGKIVALVERRQQAVQGSVELAAELLDTGVYKVRVSIKNTTPSADCPGLDRNEAAMSALVSTHTVLGVDAGEFVSLVDPPEPWKAAPAACRNIGTWPVLVGQEGDKDTLLSAPIILYDYPEIAPESPGDFFDGTEIDEMLTLRILTLTDEEKQAMAGLDERMQALLKRTESLSEADFRGLHGTLRTLHPITTERP